MRRAEPPAAATWAVALLLLAATGPLYPLLIRGWSEWTTDLGPVREARRLVWLVLYPAMAWLVWRWRRAAWAAFAPNPALVPALLWFAASCLWSPSPPESFLALVQFALILAFGGAAAARLGAMGTLRAVRLAGTLCVIGSVALALVAPRYAFGQHVNAGAFRGLYAEKNHLAAVLSYALAAAAFELAARRRRPVRLWIQAGAILAALVAARSSVALGQAALAIGLAGGLAATEGARYGRAALACCGFAAFAALGAALPAALAALGEDPTLNGRTELWALLWPHVEARPLLGHGFFGFWSRPEADAAAATLGWNVRGAHNGWMTALLTVGAVGAGLWALHWAGVLRAAFAALGPGRDPALAGCGALALAHVVWSLFESNQLTQMNHDGIVAGFALALPFWVGRARRQTGRRPRRRVRKRVRTAWADLSGKRASAGRAARPAPGTADCR